LFASISDDPEGRRASKGGVSVWKEGRKEEGENKTVFAALGAGKRGWREVKATLKERKTERKKSGEEIEGSAQPESLMSFAILPRGEF
jgi:hypothetical protein